MECYVADKKKKKDKESLNDLIKSDLQSMFSVNKAKCKRISVVCHLSCKKGDRRKLAQKETQER